VKRLNQRDFVRLAGFFLMPIAAAGYGLALWRFAADMQWSGEFFIDGGLFSRWQVWLAVAMATHATARHIGREREGGDGPVAP